MSRIVYATSLAMVVGFVVWTAPARQEKPVRDPAAEAVKAQPVLEVRPEQKLTEHDKSPAFDWKATAPLNPALKGQPNEGRILGFEFSRDPVGADNLSAPSRR